MSRKRIGMVLALLALATPALGLGPVLIHGGSPETSLEAPSVALLGGFPVLAPAFLVDLGSWLRAALEDVVEPEPEEPPVTTKAGAILIHGG